MPESDPLSPRLSAHPWRLFQQGHHAAEDSPHSHDGFYTGMLKDDLDKQRYGYEVSLTPQGVEWSRASASLFALLDDFNPNGYDRDPAALIFSFASALLDEAASGKALLLELHATPDEDRRGRARRHHSIADADPSAPSPLQWPALGYVPRWSTAPRPSGIAQIASGIDESAVIIPGTRLHQIGLRDENQTNWTKSLEDLHQVDAMKVFGNVERLSWAGYDFSAHIAAQNLAVAAATTPIGWDGRGTFADSVTSPYVAFRRLRFIRFWVETIEDCVAFLNTFTTSAALYGDYGFTFSLSGLPSPQDLTKAMAALRSGALTVGDAHRNFVFPKHSKR